jgi:hypothetical protein
MQSLPTADWRTRLAHLDTLDWIAIVIFVAGIVASVYFYTLRHP